MATFSFNASGSKAIAKIKAMQAAAEDTGPLHQAIGKTLLTRIQLGFKTSTDPWGNKWAPIKFRAPRTGKGGAVSATGRKQRQLNNDQGASKGQPLVDTGRLRNSITARADKDSVTVGTNVAHAAVLHFGATIKPVNVPRLVFPGPNGVVVFAKRVTIPSRKFLPIDKPGAGAKLPKPWSQDVLRTINRYLAAAAKANAQGGA